MAAGCDDESLEQQPLPRALVEHALRVPLNSDGEGVSIPFDRFDHSILGPGTARDLGAQRTVGLVMGAVDDEATDAEHGTEPAFGSDVNSVPGFIVIAVRSVRQGARDLGADVLHEPAAQRHAENLRAATDSENGEPARQRSTGQAKL